MTHVEWEEPLTKEESENLGWLVRTYVCSCGVCSLIRYPVGLLLVPEPDDIC